MAKDNGTSRKDLDPVLNAHAEVQAAERELDAARVKMNAAAELWVKSHGEKIERRILDDDGNARKVFAYRAKPIVIDGNIFEVRARFTKGATSPTYVLTARATM